MFEQVLDKIKNIQNVTQLKLPLLFFSLAVWVSFPILGVFPFLLTIQLDLLKPNSKPSKFFSFHSLILILVLLTVAIYLSAFDVFADTRIYLNLYENLDRHSPFDNYISKQRFEVVLFLFLAVINFLSNESTFWCLFSLALLNNSFVIFYISKRLSPKYYPTLLIIIFSSYFYYSQVFYMRQFLALVLVLAAIVNIESNIILFILFSLLAVFSHTASVVYILVCLLVFTLNTVIKILRKFGWRKIDKILLYISLFFIVVSLLYLGIQIYNNPQAIYRLINNLLDFVPQEKIARSVQERIAEDQGRDRDLFEFSIFLAMAMLSTGIFIIARSYRQISLKMITMIALYIVSVLQILLIISTGFNQRVAYLFLAFFGLFFSIGLDDQQLNPNNKIKNFSLVSAMTILMAVANTYNFLNIQVNMIDIDGWSFFNKHPLSFSLFDYITYFFTSI